MNLATLRTETQWRCGTAADDAMLTPAVLSAFVNDANQHVASVHDWPWQQVEGTTFATVAGQNDYVPPADWLRTSDLRITAPPQAGQGMTLYSVMELDDRWPPNATGQPVEYAMWGGIIRLAPAPDTVYTVAHRYIKLEPALVADGDVPLMPAQFHPIIAEYAAYLGCRRISEEARGNVALAGFDRWLAIMHQDRRRSTAPQRVRVRPGNLI